MKAVFWLIQDVVCGRPGPHLEPWSLAELRAGGIEAIINLSELPSEASALAAAGIEACWVPLPTDVPPTRQSHEQCLEALPRAYAFVSGCLARRRRVLVHCHAGKDRTGMLLALLVAKRDGVTAAEAIQRVRAVRPLALTAPGWETLALAVIPAVVTQLP